MKKYHFSLSPESLTYLFLWVLLLLAPLISEWMLLHTVPDTSFEWSRICNVWLYLLPFFFVFVIHNWFLAPLLVYRHKRAYYLIGVMLVVALFAVYECSNRPPEPRHPPRKPERMELPVHKGPRPSGPPHHIRPGKKQRPPLLFGQHDLMAVIILILMLGMNIGVKFYFRQLEGERRMRELERENLAHQLAYLRYQVNPHFLMNTLNNIHALIDIDVESAQNSIVELSRLLRYSLYDAERERVPLTKEVEFLRNYLALMRIRYNDQVDIQLEVPTPLPACDLPPLIYACFVENAFKHGISYQQHSFVHISLQVENGRLLFSCLNSRKTSTPSTPETEGGMGLRNVRQRLELLFPGNYTLDLLESAETYAVQLNIPVGC